MSDSDRFPHLDAAARGLARLAARPVLPIQAALVAAVLLSFAMLVWMSASAVAWRQAIAGPGAAALDMLPLPEWPAAARFFVELCLTPASGVVDLPRFIALTVMWFLMAVAMMLPSAAPMIRTYCEIADTARRSDKEVVHPIVFVSGYLSAWLLASMAFASLTVAVQSLAGEAPLSGWAGAAALGLAGGWQLSPLKQACLEKCRAPFATLFARWSTATAGVIRLGLEQGVWCLGCCWALMLVMFVAGIMNVFWMALLGVFVLVEKLEPGRWPTRISGAILLVWAVALLVVSI